MNQPKYFLKRKLGAKPSLRRVQLEPFSTSILGVVKSRKKTYGLPKALYCPGVPFEGTAPVVRNPRSLGAESPGPPKRWPGFYGLEPDPFGGGSGGFVANPPPPEAPGAPGEAPQKTETDPSPELPEPPRRKPPRRGGSTAETLLLLLLLLLTTAYFWTTGEHLPDYRQEGIDGDGFLRPYSFRRERQLWTEELSRWLPQLEFQGLPSGETVDQARERHRKLLETTLRKLQRWLDNCPSTPPLIRGAAEETTLQQLRLTAQQELRVVWQQPSGAERRAKVRELREWLRELDQRYEAVRGVEVKNRRPSNWETLHRTPYGRTPRDEPQDRP